MSRLYGIRGTGKNVGDLRRHLFFKFLIIWPGTHVQLRRKFVPRNEVDRPHVPPALPVSTHVTEAAMARSV